MEDIGKIKLLYTAVISLRSNFSRSKSSYVLVNSSRSLLQSTQSRSIQNTANVHTGKTYDAIIVGGGHNGLVCSSYLAKEGLNVLVLERRHIVGGAAVTEEIIPGFKFSRASYLYSLFRPRIIKDLNLQKYGLELLPRYLFLGSDMNQNVEEIAKFSRKDAAKYPLYDAEISRIVQFIEPLLDVPPFDPSAGPVSTQLQSLKALLGGALKVKDKIPEIYELLVAPAQKIIERWFESEPLKSTLATDAVIGAMVSPSTPGSGYVLLHHVMGEVNGVKGIWAYVKGGMGALSQAVATSAQSLGVEIKTNTEVDHILIKDGQAAGVVLKDGTEIRSKTVFSNATPRVTFMNLLQDPKKHLPDEFYSRVKGFDFANGAVTKINVALDRLPNFKAVPGTDIGPQHKGTIHFTQNMEEIETAFADAKNGIPSVLPVVEMTIPSSLDDSLAPKGKHVAGLFVQYTPYHLTHGSWNDPKFKEQFADKVFSVIEKFAPGFTSSVIGRDILTPVDLERVFGLTEGNIFHGAMNLNQLFWMRPAPGVSRHQSPIPGLYLCGSGAHPGGGVMGASGRNAAMIGLQDMKNPNKFSLSNFVPFLKSTQTAK